MPPNHRFSTYRLSPAFPPFASSSASSLDATSYRSLYNVQPASAREPSNGRESLHLAVRRAYLAWSRLLGDDEEEVNSSRLLVELSSMPSYIDSFDRARIAGIACPRATVPRMAGRQSAAKWQVVGDRRYNTCENSTPRFRFVTTIANGSSYTVNPHPIERPSVETNPLVNADRL